jgi:hypothetical protein
VEGVPYHVVDGVLLHGFETSVHIEANKRNHQWIGRAVTEVDIVLQSTR